MIKVIRAKLFRQLCLLFSLFLFCCLIACGGSKDTADTGGGTTTPSAANIDLAASPTSVKSDDSNTSTITITALNSLNAALSGITITLGTDTGILGAPNVTTGTDGSANVTFHSGGIATNRTATITASSGSVSKQIPIQITGSSVTLTSSSSSISTGGTATLTVTATDAGGGPVSGAAVTFSQSASGIVTISPTSTSTNASGKFYATVTGATAGTVTITATALGATATTDITVASTTNTFYIDQLILDSGAPTAPPSDKIAAMKINATLTPYTPHSLNIEVNAPSPIASVTFATTIGEWDGGTSKTVTKPVASNKANATLTSTQAGAANVQVYKAGAPSTSDTLTVAMSSGAAPYSIILQASPTNVPVSVGSTTGSSTLTATVYDNASPTPNPIGGAQVLFTIVNPTSGGETVSPVVVTTAETAHNGLSLGQARATFTSGSMVSGGTGIKVRASVVDTSVETGTTPSGNDAAIIIGGQAGSIAFGQATVISEDSTKSNYIWPMSILVADSAGAAVAGAVVSLSVWPIAWSTGTACSYDPDGATTGTFWNEDNNENLFLDAAEDGSRYYYADKTRTSFTPGGTADGYLTPVNSAGGTVPSTVTTDSNGVAGFNVTYTKESAIWTIDRIRATTSVAGSETRGEIILRLPAMESDVNPCRLGNSPYTF